MNVEFVDLKPVVFMGNSLKTLQGFDEVVRSEIGYQIHKVQSSGMPSNYKPMTTVGSGVFEIRIQEDKQYRVIYISKYENAVYVLHAFIKKSQKTNKHDIDIAKKALKEAEKLI